MPKGPAIYGTKWERLTSSGYLVKVVRDADMEDMLKTELDIKRGIYHVVVLDGDDVVELVHEFNLADAVERAKVMGDEYERGRSQAKKATSGLEDYL